MGNRRFSGAAALLIGFFSLAGCADRASKFPPAGDYCQSLERTMPASEKRTVILTNLYFSGHLPAYFANHLNRTVGEVAHRREVKRAVAQFIEDNPLCCQMLRPDHLGNMIFNNEFYLDDYYKKDYEWGYTGDVFIFTKSPDSLEHYPINKFFDANDLERGMVLMVNNCGQVKEFFRG
ncbi:hypothetical protein BA950_07575 [Erythrobacter sp. SAORIC-644]|nr:hypothetical protein BA950_07575 [Erythrobacter sp. SAORIC-644]